MVANRPGEIGTAADEGLRAVVMDRLGQVFCALHGHDHLLQFEGERLFLKCMSCGHESPGWDIPKRVAASPFGQAVRSKSHAHHVPARRVA